MAYVATACMSMANIVMAYIVTTFIVMAYIVLAYIVMAHVVVSYLGMAVWVWDMCADMRTGMRHQGKRGLGKRTPMVGVRVGLRECGPCDHRPI